VDFFGYLVEADNIALSKASIFFEARRSELGPNGEVRTGYARNVVTVEAEGGDAAIAKVQDALGPEASECSEWHTSPA
jgi:hypothetical protein